MWRRLFCASTMDTLGGPLGALVRGALDVLATGIRRLGARNSAHDATFTLGIIVLGAKMAKADGRVTAAEIAAFREVFRVPPEALDHVGRVFDRARRDALGYEPYARQIAQLFADQPEMLEQILIGLFHVAKADGAVTDDELAYLAAVAVCLGFDADDYERIRAAEVTEDGRDPYAVLGVPRDADPTTVKRAYLDLVRRHHPDRLHGVGLPPEFVAQAQARLAVVNVAYRQIVLARGLAA